MAKEVLDKILRKEEEAKEIIRQAELCAEREFRDAEDVLLRERTVFYGRLKAEKNEKLRRVYMQTKLAEESARAKAESVYEYEMESYKKFFDKATEITVNTVLEGGGNSVGSKDL